LPTLRRIVLVAANLALAAAALTSLMMPRPDHRGLPPRRTDKVAHMRSSAIADASPQFRGAPVNDLFAATEAPAEQTTAPPSPPDPPSVTLVGTGLGSSSFAVLQSAGGTIARLREGEAIDGWHLQAIRRNTVVLMGQHARWRLGFPPDVPRRCLLSTCADK
jgi:hypothetical protein